MMMQEQRQSNNHHRPITFASRTFHLSQGQSGKISLYFDVQAQGLRFFCDHLLQKINFKTVVAGLQGGQNAVSASLKRRKAMEYQLRVRVQQDFLMPIEEILIFSGRRLSQDQKQRLTVKKDIQIQLQKIKNVAIEHTGECFQNGQKIAQNGSISIVMPIFFETTMYSFNLAFTELKENTIFVDFVCSNGKKRVKLDAIPKQGIFVMGQTEFNLLVQKQKFKDLHMCVTGKFQSVKYLIKYERVQSSQKMLDNKKKYKIIAISISILLALSLIFAFAKGFQQGDSSL